MEVKPQKSILFIILTGFIILFFFFDLIFGSIHISLSDILDTFFGSKSNSINSEILLNYRLPKAITAILAGASLSVAGLMMQTLFRNPLADPYILGVSSGASLGVAIAMMAIGLLPFSIGTGSSVIIIAAILGASLIMILVMGVSFKIQNSVSLLLIGIMFGTIASSIVGILQYFSNPDAIKLFVMWNLGSLSGVTWQQLFYLIPIIFAGLIIASTIHNRLDVILLGENYSSGLGVNLIYTRLIILISTGLLVGAITAFTGPIAFIGIAVPHIARGIFKTSRHKILIPASILIGATLLLGCDIVSQIPTYTLPINTISSLFGAPIIIWIILRRK